MSAVLISAMAVLLYPTSGLAQVNHRGDNKLDNDLDGEAEGGDAIAGSQIITVTGAQNSQITAHNRSRHAKARGGDAKGEITVRGNVGPKVKITGPSGGSSANATGEAEISQVASPNVAFEVDQLAFSAGEASLAATGLSSTMATGTSNLSPTTLGTGGAIVTATGILGPVDQSITQTNNSPVTSLASPVLNVIGDNTATITGAASVTQSGTARSSPAAIAFGSGTVSANAAGVAPVSQAADPEVTITLGQSAVPTGRVIVSNTATSSTTMIATNNANGTLGTVDQTITQTNSSPVSTTASPVMNVIANNAATIVGTAPVDQTATAVASPASFAVGGPGGIDWFFFHGGNNSVRVDVDANLVGGDAIAGSNVIAVAGVGNSTIIATNDSWWASSRGGDTELDYRADVEAGPKVTIEGATSGAPVNATGAAAESQTAVPSATIAATGAPSRTALRFGDDLSRTVNQTGAPLGQPLATVGTSGPKGTAGP